MFFFIFSVILGAVSMYAADEIKDKNVFLSEFDSELLDQKEVLGVKCVSSKGPALIMKPEADKRIASQALEYMDELVGVYSGLGLKVKVVSLLPGGYILDMCGYKPVAPFDYINMRFYAEESKGVSSLKHVVRFAVDADILIVYDNVFNKGDTCARFLEEVLCKSSRVEKIHFVFSYVKQCGDAEVATCEEEASSIISFRNILEQRILEQRGGEHIPDIDLEKEKIAKMLDKVEMSTVVGPEDLEELSGSSNPLLVLAGDCDQVFSSVPCVENISLYKGYSVEVICVRGREESVESAVQVFNTMSLSGISSTLFVCLEEESGFEIMNSRSLPYATPRQTQGMIITTSADKDDPRWKSVVRKRGCLTTVFLDASQCDLEQYFKGFTISKDKDSMGVVMTPELFRAKKLKMSCDEIHVSCFVVSKTS